MQQSDQCVSVLFVCLGNICRSPLAEGVFRHLVRQNGWESRFAIDSAGTSAYHTGEPPDARSAAVAARRGIRLAGESRPLSRGDLEQFDYIIVMDQENLGAVKRLAGSTDRHGRIHRLREFDAAADADLDVPDPYFGGTTGFERVHDIVERSCVGLLQHIAQERGW